MHSLSMRLRLLAMDSVHRKKRAGTRQTTQAAAGQQARASFSPASGCSCQRRPAGAASARGTAATCAGVRRGVGCAKSSAGAGASAQVVGCGPAAKPA
jgi:hypothetical protein